MPFPIEEKYVLATEENLRGKLPYSYRAKMMIDNGGEVFAIGDSWDLHPVADLSSKNRIKRTCNDLIRETESAKKWHGFPDEAITIGENGSGDRLVLLRATESRFSDTVYVWDHETTKLHTVAKSFAKLESAA